MSANIQSHSETNLQRGLASYGPEQRQANQIGANAAGVLVGLSNRCERPFLLQLLCDPLLVPHPRYLVAVRVSLRLMDEASWLAMVLALRAQLSEELEALRAMLTERLEELLEALAEPLKREETQDQKPPPRTPAQARPAVRPGAPS